MIESDIVQRRRRGEGRDVAAEVAVVFVGAHHHRHRVPADVVPEPFFDVVIARKRRLLIDRDRVTYGVVWAAGVRTPRVAARSTSARTSSLARPAPSLSITPSRRSSHSRVSCGRAARRKGYRWRRRARASRSCRLRKRAEAVCFYSSLRRACLSPANHGRTHPIRQNIADWPGIGPATDEIGCGNADRASSEWTVDLDRGSVCRSNPPNLERFREQIFGRCAPRRHAPPARTGVGRAAGRQPLDDRARLPGPSRRRPDRPAGGLRLARRGGLCAPVSPSARPRSRGGSPCRRGGSDSSRPCWANSQPASTANRIAFVQGVPPAEPSPLADLSRCFARAGGDEKFVLTYGDSEGYAPLREAIALRMRARGCSVDPRDVLMLTGSTARDHPGGAVARGTGRRDRRRGADVSGRAADLPDRRAARADRPGR